MHFFCNFVDESALIFGFFGYKALGGKNHCCNGCCVVKCAAGYFNGVNNTCFDHVGEFFGEYVETVTNFSGTANFVDNNGTVKTCVNRYLAHRFFKSTNNDGNTSSFVAGSMCKKFFNFADYVNKSNTAACYDTLFNCCFGSVESVFDTEFLFSCFGFGCSAAFNNCYTANEFCKSFLKFFTVIVAVCGFVGSFDNSDTSLDFFFGACTVNDKSFIFVNFNFLSSKR